MGTNDHQLDDFFGLKPDDNEPSDKKTFRELLAKKFSFASGFRLLPKVLSFRERYLILTFLVIGIGALMSVPFAIYYHYTSTRATDGGSFSEGIVGEPRFINPLLSQTNDADRDLVSLTYSGLLKYNEEGKLVPDLAKSYEISSDGLTYTVYLRDDALWHDGQPFTADDVLYTIQTAQNSDYASPQRVAWQGVDVAKVNATTIMFKLKNPYAQFLNNLTLGILPAHIWQDVKPINFTLSEYNLKPIGTGYYRFSSFRKDKLGHIASYKLTVNKDHYGGRAHIDAIELKFYPSEDAMIQAYNTAEIQSLAFVSPENLRKLQFKSRLAIRRIKLPRYFAAFINQSQSKALADKNIRLALNYATDRKAILKRVLDDNGVIVNSPLIGGILDINPDVKSYEYDLDTAKKILAADGWANPNANGILTKGKDTLAITITTSTWPELATVAGLLKDQWKNAGVDVTIQTLPISQLQQTIKERAYQMLLFGEILNIDPDPFSLWHSSQKRDPGLNLALYDNKTADGILEDARQTLNPLDRAKKYDDFQKLVIEDVPAIFLYSPSYLYAQNKDIRGFSTAIISMPSDRFANINHWYIDTKRSFK